MKKEEAKEEWQKRWPLDRNGVAVLGQALLLRAEDLSVSEDEYLLLVRTIHALSRRACKGDAIKKLTARDFRWRWYHFENYPALLSYVKPDLPYWAGWIDQKTPISERDLDDLIKVLTAIFFSEASRILGRSIGSSKAYIHHEEFHKKLRYVDVTEPETDLPKRRYPDGFYNAVNMVAYEYEVAKEKTERPSVNALVTKVVERFDIISPDALANHPDPDWALVANSKKAAIKTLREMVYQLVKTNQI